MAKEEVDQALLNAAAELNFNAYMLAAKNQPSHVAAQTSRSVAQQAWESYRTTKGYAGHMFKRYINIIGLLNTNYDPTMGFSFQQPHQPVLQ
jgi:hypothetical protein